MKANLFSDFSGVAIRIFAAMGFFAACSKELPVEDNVSARVDSEDYTFEAVLPESLTKTVIQDETAVYWSPKDTIKVFYGAQTSGRFVGNNSAPAATTTFKGKFEGMTGSINIGMEDVDFWGLYPYDEEAICDGETVTVTLPAAQSAVDGTFASNLFPALAKSSGLALAFYNVCGGVMFTVSQNGITSVSFRGNNGESLAGTAKVTMGADGKPEVGEVDDAKSMLTVAAPDGGSFKTGVKYYIVAFPASLTGGFSITYNKSGSTATYTSSSAVTISRSVFGKIEDKDSGLPFSPITGNISFADSAAKSACVEKYDTDKDGEISYTEAAAVTTLEKLFENHTDVSSFEEIKYFVNATSLQGTFNGCTKLGSVTIPNNITLIGNNAFYGCSSLDEITLPSSITSIGSQSFDSNLKTVYMAGTVPPSIEADSFVVGTIFYVPASAYQAYHSGWTAHAANIRAILGGANCFVIPGYSQYFFDATKKGNSEESVGAAASAEVLWESFGTAVAPSVGDIVSNVSYKDGRVYFTASGQDGNAVIAVKDAAGNVLWSWHIWVCKDFEPVATAQVYKNGAGTMMDRNLGALSATPGDLGALGLLYQWGRKDPFLGNISITSESPYGTSAASTIEWPHTASSDASDGTIAFAVSYPTRFITCNSYNSDWYYTGSAETDNTRWLPTKTMYDPCPDGWRVPEGGDNSIWAQAFGSSAEFSKGPWDSVNRGMDFGSGNGKESSMQLGADETIWYPATGCRSFSVGGVKYPGSNGYYWTTTPCDTAACSFFFDLTAKVAISSGRERAAARSVRCIME